MRQTIQNLFIFFYFKLQRMSHTLMNLYLTRSVEGLEGDRNKGNICIAFSEMKNCTTINQHLIE